jgi:hypothetical protein
MAGSLVISYLPNIMKERADFIARAYIVKD